MMKGTAMKKAALGIILVLVLAAGVFFLLTGTDAAAGPNGGDIVPLAEGDAYAELLANSDTGEVMVHTWDEGLKTAKPIKSEPLTLGSGDQSVELMPHPTSSDPAGYCSRFYGQADWVRGGGVQNGWMHQAGHAQHRREFAWQQCWKGGENHDAMWTEMGQHHRGGDMGHGPSDDDARHMPGPAHD